jgi:hypothetical protein
MGIISKEELQKKTYFKLVEEDGTVQMHLAFNFDKKMIDEVRTLIHDDAGNHLNKGSEENFGSGRKYNFAWDGKNKIWRGPFNVYLFRSIYYFAKKHDIEIDNTVSILVSTMSKVGSKKEWTPHMRIVHDRIYVCGLAEAMMSYLDKADLTDTSLRNIEHLSRLGLAIPDEYDDIREYVTAGSISTGHEIRDNKDRQRLRSYIKQSGRKCVFYTPNWSSVNKYESEINALDPNIKQINATDLRQGNITVDSLIEEGYNTLITAAPAANLFFSQQEMGKFALRADKVIYVSKIGTE